MSRPDVLAGMTDAEIRRHALCGLNCDRSTIDWKTAAAQYDPNVKPESFKTVTSKAYNKFRSSLEAGDPLPATPETKTTAKRKTADQDDGDGVSGKKQKGKAGPSKKQLVQSEAKDDMEDDSDAAVDFKTEEAEDDAIGKDDLV